jgi:hypothetical protein
MKFNAYVLVLGLSLLGYWTLGLFNNSVAGSQVQTASNKVVEDQVTQYNIAVRAGTKMDRCVQAGFVASAYGQAKDEPNSEEWARIRHDDCKAAGLPQ